MTDWTPRSALSTAALDGSWGDWFGNFATIGAAKRYLTMQWIGPKVGDRDSYPATEIRQVDGRWQVRIFYSTPTSFIFEEAQ